MDIHPTAQFSLTARFDRTFPIGIHVGENSYVAFHADILVQDMTRGLYLHTRIGRNCFIGGRSILLPGIEAGAGRGRADLMPREMPIFRMLAGGVILALMRMLVLAFLATSRGGGQVPAPQDIALAGALPEGPLRITAFGTSLTALPQTWPDLLTAELTACRGAPVSVTRLAGVGMGSAWALDQVGAVVETRPDLIVMEFVINDSDLLDGVSLRATGRSISTFLGRDLPEAQILLLTMSPAQGPRGWIRPNLARHYGQYHDIAREAGAGILDLHPRWQALLAPRAGWRGMGCVPIPALQWILPAILTYLGCGAELEEGR